MTRTRDWTYRGVVADLDERRRRFARSGGHSKIDPRVRFHDLGDVLRYLPRAAANALLAPYPWQWLDVGGGTGVFRALSAVEALLLYACLVPLTIGLVTVLARGSPDAIVLAAFVVVMAAALGLVVTNLGTLFRLRLEALLPLFIVGGLGWTRLPAALRRSPPRRKR